MPYCSVANCCNKSAFDNLRSGGISYHVFPRNPSIQKLWILATGKKNFIPNKYNTICSAHFREKDFKSYAVKRLLYSWAYPTVDVWNTNSGTEESRDRITPPLSKRICYEEETINVDESIKDNNKEKNPEDASSSDHEGDEDIPESKVIISRVYKYFKNEYEILKAFTGNHWELNPLANYLQRTVEATGVDEKTVQIIVEEITSLEEAPAAPEQEDIIHLDVETELPVCHLKKIIFHNNTDSIQPADNEKNVNQEKSVSNVRLTNTKEETRKDYCLLRSLLAERTYVPDNSEESADGNDDQREDERQPETLKMEVDIGREQIGKSSSTVEVSIMKTEPPDPSEGEPVVEEKIPGSSESLLIKEEPDDDKVMLHMELNINKMISDVLQSNGGHQIGSIDK